MALLHLARCSAESDQQHRDRMFWFVHGFGASKVLTKDGAKHWCSSSKTPEERAILGHAGPVKRVAARFLQVVEGVLNFQVDRS